MNNTKENAISIKPMQWAETYLSAIPDLKQAIEAFSKHDEENGESSQYSKLTFDGWVGAASAYFKSGEEVYEQEDKEDWADLYRFISALNWSYSRICYGLDKGFNTDFLLNGSGHILPSKVLLNLANNDRCAVYVTLDDERKPKIKPLENVDGVVFMIMETMGEDGELHPALHMVPIVESKPYPVELPIGDWSINEAYDKYLAQYETNNLSMQYKERTLYFLNLALFIISSNTTFIEAEIENTTSKHPGLNLKPEILRLLTTSHTELNPIKSKWTALEAGDGSYSLHLA